MCKYGQEYTTSQNCSMFMLPCWWQHHISSLAFPLYARLSEGGPMAVSPGHCVLSEASSVCTAWPSLHCLVSGRLWSSYLKEAPFLSLLTVPASHDMSQYSSPASFDPSASSFQLAEFHTWGLESKLCDVFKSGPASLQLELSWFWESPTINNFLFY